MAEPARRRRPAGQSARESLVTAGRVRLSRHVDAITADQTRAWAAAWQTVHDDLVKAAADAVRQAEAAGKADVPAAYRTARLSTSLDELTKQLRELGRRQGVTVSGLVAPAVTIPVEVQRQLFQAGGVAFNLPPGPTLRAITGRTAQRIASDYPKLTAAAEQQLRQALVRGIAAGAGPRQAAAQLVAATRGEAAAALGTTLAEVRAGTVAQGIVDQVRGAFAGGLARANNLVRTELLDASRMATRESYLANPGLVSGWRWLSARDARTCPACWGMHNSVHPPDEVLEGHQQCRCAPVPILAGDDEVDPLTGRTLDDVGDPDELLGKLSPAEQLQVLGPQRLAAWRAGTSLRAMATRRNNVGWRPSHVVTPLRDLPDPPAPLPPPGMPPQPHPPPPPRPPAPAPVVDTTPAYVAEVRELLDQLPADRSRVGMVERPNGALVQARASLEYARRQAADGDSYQASRLPDLERDVARLEARNLPTSWAPDIAEDGGPGDVAMQHLEQLRTVGRRVNRQVQDELLERPELQAAYRQVADADQLASDAALSQARLIYDRPQLMADPAAWRRRFEQHQELVRRSTAAATEAADARSAIAAARRDATLAVLSRVRTMGRRGTLQVEVPRNAPKAVKEWLAAALRHAEAYYPQEWLDRRARVPLRAKAVQRGYQQGDTIALSDDLGSRTIRGAPRGNRVAIHELGHAMEGELEELRRMEWAEHWRRTTDGQRVKSGPNKGHRKRTGDNALRTLPGYSSREKGRRDKYRDGYTSKEYGGGHRDHYELFTTWMESAFAGSKYDDEEAVEWLLGVLTAL